MIYFYLQVHTYQQPDWFRFSFINVRIWLRWNNVNTMLQQRCTKLFWNCFNVCLRRCINFVQCWKSDVGFCFIFNVGTMLFQRLCTALKQIDPTLNCWLGLFSGNHTVYTIHWRREEDTFFKKKLLSQILGIVSHWCTNTAKCVSIDIK